MKKLTKLLLPIIFLTTLACNNKKSFENPTFPEHNLNNQQEKRIKSEVISRKYWGLFERVGSGESLSDIEESLPEDSNKIMNYSAEFEIYSVTGKDTLKTTISHLKRIGFYRKEAPKILNLMNLKKGDKISTVEFIHNEKDTIPFYHNQRGQWGIPQKNSDHMKMYPYTKEGKNNFSQIKIIK